MASASPRSSSSSSSSLATSHFPSDSPTSKTPTSYLTLISKHFAALMKIQDFSLAELADTLITVGKSVTGSMWGEFMYVEGEELVVCTTSEGLQSEIMQSIDRVPISSSSAAGLCAVQKSPLVINHTCSSQQYQEFKLKFTSFTANCIAETPQHLICCPLYGENEKLFGVLELFDKADSDGFLCPYTADDLSLLTSISTLLSGILSMQSHQKHLRRYTEQLDYFNTQRHNLAHLSLQLIRKDNLMRLFRHIITDSQKVTCEYVDLMAEAMECQGVLIHLVTRDQVVCPWIVYGIEIESDGKEVGKMLCTRTSEYVAMDTETVLYVRDYTKEKHFSGMPFAGWESKFRTSLSLSILQGRSLIGVIEFYRKEADFTSRDEHIAHSIASIISEISVNGFNSNLPKADYPYQHRISPHPTTGILEKIREFSLRREGSLFDFVRYGRQLRCSIRDLVRCESCAFFIRDALTNTIWTWVAYTLLGYAISKKQIINEQFPNADEEINELFEGDTTPRCSLVVPILGEILKDQTLGVVVLTRKEGKFTENEVSLIRKLLLVTGFTLESLFFSTADLQPTSIQYSQHLSPPTEPKRLRKKERLFTLPQRASTMRVVDEPEYSQQVRRSRTMTDFPDDDCHTTCRLLSCLCRLTDIPANRLNQVNAWLMKIKQSPEHTLSLLLQELTTLVPCQQAKLFMLHSSKIYLQDIETESLYTAVGVAKEAIFTCKSINTKGNVSGNLCSNLRLMGISIPIDSVLAIPIAYLQEEVVGLMLFINSASEFSSEDQAIAEFLSLVPSHAVLTAEHSVKKWSDVLRQGLKQEQLLAWCKQIMGASVTCQQTACKLKDITHSLLTTSDFPHVISALLEVICANLSVEEATVILRHRDGYLAAFTRLKGLKLLPPNEETEKLKEFMSIGGSLVQENYHGKVNLLNVSIRGDLEIIGCLKLCNKRDLSLSVYCNFTTEDIAIAQRYASQLAGPLTQWLAEAEANTEQLRRRIHKTAATVHIYPLMNIIRRAALRLLDCDRSTVFIREGDQMVLYSQGTEQELPEGFSMPIGAGIVGHVAQTRQPICLDNAYKDPRFSRKIDDMTGYKTTSMLCVPVLDSNHQVIAALQMINKKRGNFNEEDMKLLDIFRDVISSALQIFDRFKTIAQDNSSLRNIFNHLQSHVIVINTDGKVDYCNEKFEELFGYPENVGRNQHFSFWLRENPELIQDLQAVLESPGRKITKEYQSLKQSQLKRTSAMKTAEGKKGEDELKVHYSVYALHDIAVQEVVGLVLVIEDVTKLVEMDSDLRLMRIRLKELSDPSTTRVETGLSRCICTLQQLQSSLSSTPSTDITAALNSVLSILKSGDLDKTEVFYAFNSVENDSELKVYIDREFLRRNSEAGFEGKRLQMHRELGIKQWCSSELRKWDLNIWGLGELIPHVVAMFAEFNLLTLLGIRSKVLMNFLGEIRKLYEIRHNSFHNFTHGVSVMHSLFFLLTSTKVQTWFFAEEIFGLLLAALCHDVDHTARTNSFEISSGSTLALRYHDISVLEQHHAATTFFTMQQEQCNILSNCPKDTYQSIRKLVISGILGTDMTKHFSMLLKMNLRFKDMQESRIGEREHDKMDVAELIVHSCDLAHLAKSFELCSRWAQLLKQEFIAQSKEEIALGLDVTPFIRDLEDVRAFYKNEVNFITVIGLPLWECLHQGLQPYTAPQLKAVSANIAIYKELLAQVLETNS